MILLALTTLVTFLIMEGITWCTHKFVMHGFLWYLHEDHHQPKYKNLFEKNDLFFIIFALPSSLSIYLGLEQEMYFVAAIGFGIMAYGAAYFLVHDVLIHQRFKWFKHTKNWYLLGLRKAHKIHHKKLMKHDGECFGMLYVPLKYFRKPQKKIGLSKKKPKKAIVIGAGIAGLSVAIRLQNAGFKVEVFESNDYPGGKLTDFSKNGYRFDMGPSLFTMPQFIEELFYISKKNIKDYFSYKKKEIACHYFFKDGTTFEAKSDVHEFAKTAAKTFNVDKDQLLRYFNRSKKKYDLTSSLFLEKSLHKFSTYFSKDTIKAIFNINSLDINSTLHNYNTKNFDDFRLVQLFDRFATYNGSSPYQTPGIMSMIPHLEQYYGTFFPTGGMHSITQSIYQLALNLGVKFHFNSKVDKIHVSNKKAVGISSNHKDFLSDIVISNSDVVPTYRFLLKDQKSPEKILRQPRSSSALIFYWGIRKEFHSLDLHNIFFSEDYKQEFQYIFNKQQVYKDPTVYVNISSKENKSDAPKGCENWFVMVNVPSNTGQDWDTIIKNVRSNILKKLSVSLSVNLEDLIESETVLDPRLIESNTNSYQGALYGASSNNKFAAFLRHPNFSQQISNLYFCGGSVHPGGGIPLCLLSGKIVSELILKHV